jgi:glyoxylase-like metal-dependent hydrolase (beta-lactamase superfamily II)
MTIIAEDKALQIERLTLGPFGTNAYIVACRKTKASVLIDAPAEAETILEKLEGTEPKYILLTHNHIDHIGALTELHTSLKVPLAAHALDSGNLRVKPEILLKDGDTLSVGDLKFEVLHTPGHTPGSLCFKIGRYLLSGDTIFNAGPGRTRTPADLTQIIASLRGKIFVLPDDTLIYPGHGDSTVLKKEREEFATFCSRSHDPNLCVDVVWLTS